ncbi:MAG: basic amino acid/polyamine antiporter, family [Solirubrobacterales bacterium]|jgi:APA family basic amino acid/polyamine antiporter|nr:basic amino acid/polyamine antiporter, family [Solirubrobacterales bacterium]
MSGSGNLDAILATAEHDRTRLNSNALGAFSLTLLGVASVVGAGIFVVTGDAAAHYAGPAVLISFVLAGIVAGLTAICYAELASMIPAAGSTYSYAFAAFGSFVGWFIGWDLLLEYLFAASTVAVGWSGYFVSLMETIGVQVPHALASPPLGDDPGIVNLPALAIMLLTSGALWLGTRESAIANNAMVLLKLTILVLVFVVGVFYVTSSNLTPFVPAHAGGFGDFGWSGILRGAGVVFFAYIGFDAVSTAAAEARNPRRTVPIGLIGTVLIASAIYVAVGFVLVGMVDYRQLGVADPISVALSAGGRNLDWLLRLTDVAAVVGLASTVLVTLYGQTRIFMRMSEDGMLPPRFGKVSPRTKTPQFSIVVCGIVGGVVAGLVPLSVLGELISIGTLLAFIIVSAGVLQLRRAHPELPRPFRVPALPLVAGTAIVASIALMATLPGATWIRLAVWAALGFCVYFFYAREHSRVKMAALIAREDPAT